MRILWYSNAPWAGTGYGVQTASVALRIKALGHDVAIANNYGLAGASINWNDIPIMPVGRAPHSEDIILPHALAWRADWIITLYDVWPLQPLELFRDARIASWTPVDHYPVPPGVTAWAKEHKTIAMSRFGEAALREVGVNPVYAPHGVETEVFRPTPSTAREQLGIHDDAFLCVINAANKGGYPPRKAWAEMFRAWAVFSKRHKDAYLYLHSDVLGLMGAPNLGGFLDRFGADGNRVRHVDQYAYWTGQIPAAVLAALYTAGDVLLATSMGEGFGVPVIEAQACGLPVIVTDFTAQPELVGAGWKVGYNLWNDPGHGYTDFALPIVSEIVDALEAAYEKRGDQEFRQQAVDFAAQYDADTVFNTYWRPILAEMEQELQPKPVSRAKRRKNARRAA